MPMLVLVLVVVVVLVKVKVKVRVMVKVKFNYHATTSIISSTTEYQNCSGISFFPLYGGFTVRVLTL